MNGKKRKVYIDVAKGFAILLVILGHMNRFFAYEGRLMQVVYSVQLPLFLIVGGYWMRVKDGETPGQFFTKKFYRLLQPYFFYGFLSIIYAWPGNQEGFVHYFSGLLWGIGINDYLPNLPIWFLPMFFLANCWFYLALLLGKKGRNLKEQLLLEAGAVAVLMSVGLIINDPFSRLPWGFELSLIIQGFFFAGHLWRIGEERFFPEGRVLAKQKRILVLMLLPAFAVWLICVRLNGRIDLNADWFGNTGLWSCYLAAFAGCYLLLFAAAITAGCRPLAWIFSLFGENSMAVMAVHVPVLIWMDGVITPLMPQVIKENFMVKNWIGVSYSFVTISLLSLFAAMLLKKKEV